MLLLLLLRLELRLLARSQSVGHSAGVLAEKGLAEGADWSGVVLLLQSRQQGQLLVVVAGLGGWVVARWWVSC